MNFTSRKVWEPCKRHRCDLCEKDFTTPSQLEQHLLINTGDKPYRCMVGETSLTSSSSRKEHMLVGTGDKPQACKIVINALHKGVI